jgi:type I restriction enzyme R subunit
VKRTDEDKRPEEELEHAVRQIVSRAVMPEGVIDIFAAAGLKKPDISVLSEEFLADVRGMPQRNLAVEPLRKLLSGEIRQRRRKNVVQSRSFADMLEQSIRRYQNRAIEAAQVIEELIESVRNNVTIDGTMRENVRAKLRVIMKRILRKHGYPPDKQEKATQAVLEQAEVLSAAWAVG